MKSKKVKKSILIIGLGKFGSYLALKMQKLGNQVMVVDKEELESQKLANRIDDIFIGDCTNEEILKSLGVTDFDICFVTIGENFEASTIITMLLKKLGARYTVVKTGSDLQSDLLRKIGADEIIYPEKELAEKLALKYHVGHSMKSYLDLNSDYSIIEMEVPKQWLGHSLGELGLRKNFGLSVIAIKNRGSVNVVPEPEEYFRENDVIVIVGRQSSIMEYI